LHIPKESAASYSTVQHPVSSYPKDKVVKDSTKVTHTRHIEFLAKGRCADGGSYLKLSVHSGGEARTEIISLAALEREPAKTMSALDAYLVTPQARREFQQRVQETVNWPFEFDVATRPGWSGRSFILPSGEVLGGKKFAVCLDRLTREVSGKFVTCGAFEQWQRIPELARGNSRLMMALALSFAGPLVELLGVELPAVQLVGKPGTGKSGIAIAAGSVWGGRVSVGPNGFLESWNNTVNKFEELAVGHNGGLLIVDETGLVDGNGNPTKGLRFNIVNNVAMRLAEGAMKGRMNDVGPAAAWALALLSTSNLSLDEMAAEAGAVVDDALRSRLIDIPLPTDSDGAFENLHGFRSCVELTIELKRIARAHFAWASRRFLRRLVKSRAVNEAGLKRWLEGRRATYRNVARRRIHAEGRNLNRIHEKFATTFAGGALAIKFGLVPWSFNELGQALLLCQQAHVDLVGSSAPKLRNECDPWLRLQDYIRGNASEFVDLRNGLLNDEEEHDHANCPGYINRHRDGTLEYLFAETKLKQILGGGRMLSRFRDAPKAKRWIRRGENRFAVRRAIYKRGGRPSVLAIDASAFS
jgi:hypothetical protein